MLSVVIFYAECCYSECHIAAFCYSDCLIAESRVFIVILSVIVPNVTFSIVVLSAVVLNVIFECYIAECLVFMLCRVQLC